MARMFRARLAIPPITAETLEHCQSAPSVLRCEALKPERQDMRSEREANEALQHSAKRAAWMQPSTAQRKPAQPLTVWQRLRAMLRA